MHKYTQQKYLKSWASSLKKDITSTEKETKTKPSIHTIWSLIVFPSCSTVRIFYRKITKNAEIRNCFNQCKIEILQSCTYKINSNGAYVAINVRIVL